VLGRERRDDGAAHGTREPEPGVRRLGVVARSVATVDPPRFADRVGLAAGPPAEVAHGVVVNVAAQRVGLRGCSTMHVQPS
jgi:hypothetical protein